MLVNGRLVLIDGNRIVDNEGFGLNFQNGDDHAFLNNFLRGNNVGSVEDEFGNTNGGGNLQ